MKSLLSLASFDISFSLHRVFQYDFSTAWGVKDILLYDSGRTIRWKATFWKACERHLSIWPIFHTNISDFGKVVEVWFKKHPVYPSGLHVVFFFKQKNWLSWSNFYFLSIDDFGYTRQSPMQQLIYQNEEREREKNKNSNWKIAIFLGI